MPKFTFTSPDGQKYTVNGPDGATESQAFEVLQGQLKSGQAQAEPRTYAQYQAKIEQIDPAERMERNLTRRVGGPALQMLSGAAGSIVGGVEGIVRGAGAGAAALAGGEGLTGARNAFVGEASETIETRQSQLTRAPRTEVEARANEAVGKPFKKLARVADVAGEKVSDASGSPALGATVNTVIQSAPALIGKGLSRAGGAVSRLGRGKAPPGPPQPPAGMSATGAPRGPMTDLGGAEPPVAPRGTPPQGPAGGPGGAQATPATQPPPPGPAVAGGTAGGPQGGPAPKPSILPEQTERARAYAERIGLNWADLGAGTRAALENIAQDATALDRLNPAQVKRQAHLEGQRIPVPFTRSQVTLDPVDARREAIAARTSEGGRIRDVDTRANAAIQGNLEALRGRVGGLKGGLHEPVDAEGIPASTPSIRRETGTPTQVGSAFQKALRGKAKWSEAAYKALYKKARETEPDARTSVKPISDLLETNPEIQSLGWVQGWLSKAAKVGKVGETVDESGKLTQATLSELQDLRSDATAIARTGGKEGYYAGQVVKAIDQAMEEVPEGAKAWKAANDAFRKHKQEFENQGAVKRLVGNKKGSADPLTSHEGTWKKISKGSVEEIRQVKRSALTGGTPQTRAAGKAAWRQIRAETVNRILEDARKVVATDETEREILTAAALNRTVKSIPRENLEEIIGVKNTRELYGILRARKLTKGRTTESGTVPNLLVMAEKILGYVPGVGHIASGALRGAHKLSEIGKASRDVDTALTSPLSQAGQRVMKSPGGRAQRRAQLYRDIEGLGPTLGDIP